MDTVLLHWQPFTIWGGPRMSLGGVPCAPLPPMTLLSQGLVARIQKRIFLGRPYAMGFDWQPCTLLSSMGGIFGSPSSSSLGSSSAPSFWHPHGGSSFSSSPPPRHRGGLCTVVGPFPRAMGGILVRLHRFPRAWHLRARRFTLLCRRRITIPLMDLTLPCHFLALVEAYLLLSCTTPRLG
jgi:hypothetical protein